MGTGVVGGVEQVMSGGVATSETVLGGGQLVISSGGTISGATIGGPRGAVMEIMSGGLTGAPPITFTGAATLDLDDSLHFSGTLNTFTNGNFLDLKDIAFNSATTLAFSQSSPTSGTLTVSGGGATANILLLGQYTTAQFNKQSDGQGGTFVTTTVTSAGTSDLAAAVVNTNHG